jgi:hypothetical protein
MVNQEMPQDIPAINAVVAIDLKTDLEFLQLRGEAHRLLMYAESRVIESAADAKSATDDLGLISLAKKSIEDNRQRYVRPLNEYVKTVNATFKALSDPVEQADKITRSKILAYRAAAEEQRRKAEEINRQKEELARKEAEFNGTGEVTIDTTPVIVPEAQPNHIRADMGTAGTIKTRKARVIDFALLPDAYKLPNEKLLATAARTGVQSIPGVEFYVEESLRVTTR